MTMTDKTKHSGQFQWESAPKKLPTKLPPEVGKREKLRKDGTYGYVCNACGYPVGDHDGYCSECGARVAGTYFYYGKDCKPDEKLKKPTLKELLIKYEEEVLAQEDTLKEN